jgi:hypothetical protein
MNRTKIASSVMLLETAKTKNANKNNNIKGAAHVRNAYLLETPEV